MKIRTRGNQAFNVPNTEEGHLFIRLLRRFRNHNWYYRARGRGSRKEHGCQASIPQEHAEWLAVYLEKQKAQARPPPSLWVTDFGSGPRIQHGPDYYDAMFSGHVAEWSAPIGPGEPVAVDQNGRIYNAEVHGVGETGIQIGVALGPSQGAIGEGEARVPVRLDLGDALLPPAMEMPIAEKVDDAVELTAKEQGLLEEILFKLHNEYVTQNWTEEKQEIFDSLFEKLAD